MKRKVTLIMLLMLFCMVLSIIINYKDNAVFLKYDRKIPIYNVDTAEKKVAITFDCSWGDDNTEKILEILKKYNIKATFFVIGKWTDDFPDLVKKIHNDGHEIGNHSDKHPDMRMLSKQGIYNEIGNTDAKILKLTGTTTTLFRCPEGSYNDNVISTIESTGHYCIQWDVDSIDWREMGAQIEYDRVINKTKPGSIILFHNNAKYTPYNLPKIIEYLQKKGYKFVTISDLIYKNNYHIDNEGKQIKN